MLNLLVLHDLAVAAPRGLASKHIATVWGNEPVHAPFVVLVLGAVNGGGAGRQR